MTQTKSPGGKLTGKNTSLKVVTVAKFFEAVRLNAIKVYMSSNQQT